MDQVGWQPVAPLAGPVMTIQGLSDLGIERQGAGDLGSLLVPDLGQDDVAWFHDAMVHRYGRRDHWSNGPRHVLSGLSWIGFIHAGDRSHPGPRGGRTAGRLRRRLRPADRVRHP